MRLVIGISLVIALCAGCGIQRDQLDCEVAVAHLAGCCPDFHPMNFNCGSVASDAALPIAESECIIAKSCGQIKADGLCALSPNGSVDGGSAAPAACQ